MRAPNALPAGTYTIKGRFDTGPLAGEQFAIEEVEVEDTEKTD